MGPAATLLGLPLYCRRGGACPRRRFCNATLRSRRFAIASPDYTLLVILRPELSGRRISLPQSAPRHGQSASDGIPLDSSVAPKLLGAPSE